MSKFEETFKEPFYMSDGSYCINAEINRDDFIRKMEDLGIKDIHFHDIFVDLVRYGFPPDNIEDREDFRKGCWYTDAPGGPGAKRVLRWRRNSRFTRREGEAR